MVDNKKRLFEMFERVNKISLNESPLESNENSGREAQTKLIGDFVVFVCKNLGLTKDTLPKISISYNEGEAKEQKSFGGYMPYAKAIRIIATNRNLADVLRTLAHELVHHKQMVNGELNPKSGETGSEQENEANSKAGIYLREFGQSNPEIFE